MSTKTGVSFNTRKLQKSARAVGLDLGPPRIRIVYTRYDTATSSWKGRRLRICRDLIGRNVPKCRYCT